MADRTYLELADAEGRAHTFFEVSISGSTVVIRFGEVGTAGTQQSRDAGSAAAAQAEAARLLTSRRRKGYVDAVAGQSTPRRLQLGSADSSAPPAPIRWRFDTGNRAFAVCAGPNGVWVGNEDGRVFLLTRDGAVLKQFKLPDGVKCIVADSDWLYAGCDDGRVYDLTGGQPFEAYAIDSSVDIYWLDIADAVLGVSDAKGNLFAFNHEDVTQWKKKSDGERGWMLRCDEIGIYHGHAAGLTMYDWEDGEELWHRDVGGEVLYGWQDASRVYVATNQRKVLCFSKLGHLEWTADCDASVYCCSATADGALLFAGDCNSSVYCFDRQGQRQWKLATGCGSAISMHVHDDRLYFVTTKGIAACMDVGTGAVQAAQSTGAVPQVQDLQPVDTDAKLAAASLDDLAETDDPAGGVVVECYEAAGKLWVRVASSGYRADWVVQFPRNLRVKGERFVVDEIRAAARGNFYRAYGDIKRIV